ncbi:hypothetical protein QS306_09495 [Paraburkholderia bonniea]|uniref:hypothetical protein n=1 Tax=Paraburkholderia bonniea TaxID=2152891 RepID=UPI002573B1E5|nr:hypothetical protein [Paraburkholderia bonniea]WJF89356.1 hypothetical protein QS306_09495 [Paraburkholderia bonniea]WJF92671.1 hypothetical protein QS308_09505 [Paraburkholderia bonniea]
MTTSSTSTGNLHNHDPYPYSSDNLLRGVEAGTSASQVASSELLNYMNKNSLITVDWNALGTLADDQSAPDTLRAAAQFMRDNPKAYSTIENHDIGNHDGITGTANLEWAAKGGAAAAQTQAKKSISPVKTPPQTSVAKSSNAHVTAPTQNAVAKSSNAHVTAPTQNAVAKPSNAHVTAPTQNAVAKPSNAHVTAPTQNAVAKPSNAHVTAPTQNAVAKPSNAHVTAPTQNAVAKPSNAHVTAPTQNAVAKPSNAHVTAPTQNAVAKPSKTLVTAPTQNAVAKPSNAHVTAPTQNAVAKPSNAHVTAPTQNAVAKPSNAHVTAPTQNAVAKPSNAHVTAPTQNAVAKPSNAHVTAPTQNAVAKPSKTLVTAPTQNAVAKPSKTLVTAPTQNAVAKPSKTLVTAPTQNAVASAPAAHKVTAESASATILGYMQASGRQVVNMNDLYRLAKDPATNEALRAAASFMVQHKNIYGRIETHDVAGFDGISGRSNFAWASGGGLNTNAATTPSSTSTVSTATGNTSTTSNTGNTGNTGNTTSVASNTPSAPKAPALDAQSASAALLAYMQQNQLPVVNLKDLYHLSLNQLVNDITRAAAKFMLSHPDTFEKIETHDVPGDDGISGQANFSWAANGGLLPSAPTQAQTASAALLSYMQQSQLPVVNLNDLYHLSLNQSINDSTRAAAQFMLSHPDIFETIETHDVPGDDGISGQANFAWAASGGLEKSEHSSENSSEHASDGTSNVDKYIAEINQASHDENLINEANTFAKISTMGTKGSKDIVG